MSSGLIGVGMILGHSLGNGTSNTAVWLGGFLILSAAVMLGMFLSLRASPSAKSNDNETTGNSQD